MKHTKIFALALCSLTAFTPKLAAQNVTVHKQGGVGHVYRAEQVDSVVYFPIGDGEQFPAPEEEITKSLWDIIKAQPNLKKFAAILEAANYYTTNGAEKGATDQKLSQVLSGSLPLNVYAPTDAAISDAEYDRLLSLAQTDGWKLQQEFAFNHISPQEGGTAFDGNTVMLNGKRINTNACNPVPADEEAAAGKLFAVSTIIPYLPSMKEYLQVLAPDCTQAQTFMAGLEKVDTDADASILAIPTRGGGLNTLLSIISETDPLASQYLHSDGLMQIKGFGADLADENANYRMVTPTDAVWNDARAKLSSHYQYASRYEDKIQGDMGLGKSYIDIANPDSITALSMGADILVPLLGKTSEGQQTKLCNGTAFAATEWPVPVSEYMPDVEVEVTNDMFFCKASTSYFKAGAYASLCNMSTPEMKHVTENYGEVSNGNFYYLPGPTPTSNPQAEIKLIGENGETVMSGKYDVLVVMVPLWYRTLQTDPEAYAEFLQNEQYFVDSLASISKNKIRVQLRYNTGGTDATSIRAEAEYNAHRVDTVFVIEDFEFPYSYANITKSYPTLIIQSSTSSSDIRRGYVRELCIDKIILRSKEDGSEIYYAPQTNRQIQ